MLYMKNEYKYNALISYRHISPDKEIADRLQKKLENYKLPKSLYFLRVFLGLDEFRFFYPAQPLISHYVGFSLMFYQLLYFNGIDPHIMSI
jgi:hypothetical protein